MSRIVAVGARLAVLLLLSADAFAEAGYTIQCDLVRGRLLPPATINGQRGFTAVIDAGLQAPILSPQAVATLGLVEGPAHTLALDSFALSEKVTHSGDAGVGDLTAISDRVGHVVDAIAPLYQAGLELTLDASAGRVEYRPLDEAELGVKGGGVSQMRLRDGAAPMVQALINGKHLRELELDLAYPGVVSLNEDTLNTLGLLSKDPEAIRTVNGAGQTSVQFRLEKLRLGSTDLESPICEMAAGRERIGLGALQNFKVTLNYEAGLVRWASHGGGSVPSAALVGYGLTLDRLRAGQWELAVSEGSPASEAGILPGATLVSIGKTTLRQTGSDTVGRLLRAAEGQTIDINVLQQGTPLTVTLTARRLL